MSVAHVTAVGEFRNVLPHVLAADVNVRALHGSLEVRPVAFKAVNVMDASYIFLLRVDYRAVFVAAP